MKKKYLKVFFFLLIITISFVYTIKWLTSNDIDLDNNTIELLLESSGNLEPKNRIISSIVSIIKDSSLVNPVSSMLNDYNGNDIDTVIVNNEVDNIKEDNKIVYIYNTHQKEKYKSTKEININYTVMDASFYLQKKLKKYGIESFVETMSIQDVLNTNGWNYASSYRVSRMFMEQRKKEYKDLKYYIDIHRDSVNENISTITINNKRYARVMFLLGLDNKDYKKNEEIIVKLDNWLNKNYKGLSRGIYRKQGKGVNGVYNQDFSSLCFLIEVGGEENSYEEVENTIDVIAEMLNSFIGGKIE